MEQNKTWYGAMALMRAMLLIVNENCCFNPCTLLNRQNVMEHLSRGDHHTWNQKIVKNYLGFGVSLFLLLFLPQVGKSHVSEYLTYVPVVG